MQNMHTVGNILLVGIGGFAGSAARYSVSLLIRALGWGDKWPWPTFLVNLLGALVIGLLWGKVMQLPQERWIMTFGIAGFCGGFTTFSSFSLEVLQMLRSGAYGTSLIYIALSVVLCVLGVWCGWMLVRS